MLEALKVMVRRRLKAHALPYLVVATAHMVLRTLAGTPHDRDFRAFRHLDRPVLFVDVGANRGQSAMSFAAVARVPHRIVSFEASAANARCLRLVRALLGRRRHAVVLCGLGREAAVETLHTPCQGSRRITGEASFRRSVVEGAARRIDGPYRIEEERFEIRPFDTFELLPDIVKIDVQGFELDVLTGMAGLLASDPPLLLVEASPTDDAAVFELLAGFGYRPYRRDGADRLVPAAGDATPRNWFFANPTVVRRLPSLFADRTAPTGLADTRDLTSA